ncbi:hypothetical protein SESBI_02990 [Sesbania bispinosa]|nr:hypothetical protein SESBI_02990 [Sesbania bispinosa]
MHVATRTENTQPSNGQNTETGEASHAAPNNVSNVENTASAQANNVGVQQKQNKTKGKTKVATGKSKRGRPPTKNKSFPTNQQPIAPPTETGGESVQKNPTPAEATGSQTYNRVQQLQVIKNAHETSMFMMSKCGSPNMVEANKIVQELLSVAQKVISGSQYDWMEVATTLGMTHNEQYMNFMRTVDEAKQSMGVNIAASSDAGGTQHSEVTQTQPPEGSQGGVHPKPNN